MDWALLAFFFLIGIFCIIFLVRTHLVGELTRKLLHEESDWLYYHRQEFSNGHREGLWFKRQRRLPPFAVMIYKFWRPVASFEKELSPLESYYPLKK